MTPAAMPDTPGPAPRRRRHTPARVWATLYLSTIPVFAILYTLLRYDFFQSSAHREPAVLEANRRLRVELQERLRTNFTDQVGAPAREVEGWRVEGEGIEVLRVAEAGEGGGMFDERTPDYEALQFAIAVPVTRLDQRWATSVLCEGEMLLGELQHRGRSAAGDPAEFAVVLRSATFSPFGYSPRHPTTPRPVVLPDVGTDTLSARTALALAMSALPSPSDAEIQLRAPGDLVRRFHDYVWARRGVTGGVERQFERMLYFSIVVMTTLGLGDIVPMTARARLLVGLQAISGVVFAGLFLNAVANRRAWQREERRRGE
jgi:hypothetical protein